MLGNIGTLHTSPSGHVRYVPQASQWESVVAKSSAAECLRDSDADLVDDDDLQIPLARNGSISRSELLGLLPPGQYCDTLKEVYFRVFSPVFHILHDMTFEAEYQQFCHDPSSVSIAWLSLLFAILAIAVSALDDDDPLLSDLGERTVSRNIKVLSARYRSAALRCLAADGVMTRHSISSLQALVLISYARLQRGLAFWTLLGLTHHVAISMGCHIDPERFMLGPIEREERRRVWAGLMLLYTIQNTSFGSLDQQMLSQDVKVPADVDDIDLLTSPSMPITSDPSTSPSAGRPTQMTYLLLTFRLYKISNKVCETIFSYPQLSRYSVSQLEAEILAVRDMCDARYTLDSNEETLAVHHQANLNILYSQIHQLLLLLLRPTLCRYLQGEITQETSDTRAKCISSAKTSLTIFQTLLEAPQFAPYKWYTSGLGSFHAFHAAVVLAIGLLHPENPAEFDEMKAFLRRALEMFAALSVRSIFCSKAVPVVRQIIDVASTQYSQAKQQSKMQIRHTQPSPPQPLPHYQYEAQAQVFPLAHSMPTGTMSESFLLSNPLAHSPVPTVSSSTSEPTMHSSFGIHLQPQNWLGPTSIPWDTLNPSMGSYPPES
ncbi:hypothetical protein N7468_005664 [Penicillium chermesinum]|uniref:Xylanolytic transcriptional activator regulatory domain-containing protein n=1 Tax=Penicillium chermesinum TaxID=63820 RepID=A0A9W9P2A7_9EURO|nr:uncharacterized protein N7468_005664 [Penicillium chermesinum]KAJ5232708.1 hypothetical protein N7468_005664 [Penicillium chermesinum]